MMHRYALLCAALLATASCNSEVTGLEPPSNPETETFAPSLDVDIATMEETSLGVFFRDEVQGTGLIVTPLTDSVVVNYAGYLTDGTLFDSGNNVTFSLAPGVLIEGMRHGMIGMVGGGQRKLVIPSALGYGGRSVEGSNGVTIPRQSTLVFDITLITVHNPDSDPES